MIQPYPYALGSVAEDIAKEHFDLGENNVNVSIWIFAI
jgi:hypothetical protein